MIYGIVNTSSALGAFVLRQASPVIDNTNAEDPIQKHGNKPAGTSAFPPSFVLEHNEATRICDRRILFGLLTYEINRTLVNEILVMCNYNTMACMQGAMPTTTTMMKLAEKIFPPVPFPLPALASLL